MADPKNAKWLDDYREGSSSNAAADATVAGNPPAANDADGWQQYRRWISKAPAPKDRRAGLDPSLYTWKGYRSWTEQVRRNWDDESDNDSE